MSDHNRGIIEEFRANEGQVGGYFEGKSMLLLHHKGAKSGQERVNPLRYENLDGHYAVFASAAGADKNPDWYHNLIANPEATVEMGTESFPVTARSANDEEQERIWNAWKGDNPTFAEYETKTKRDKIPVVILTRR